MARLRVQFEWLTGLKRPIFRNVRLVGSWDRRGRYSNKWRTTAMKEYTAPEGCPAWRADVLLDDAQRGKTALIGLGEEFLQFWSVLRALADNPGPAGFAMNAERTSRLSQLALEPVTLPSDHPGDIISRGLAAEGHGAVDRRIDFRVRAAEQIAAEPGGNFDNDLRVAAAQAALGFRRRSDRRLHRKIPGAGKSIEQLPALRRVVLIERRHLQIFDIEGNAVAEGRHQNDGTDDRKGEPDRIAQQLDGLAPRIGPEAR